MREDSDALAVVALAPHHGRSSDVEVPELREMVSAPRGEREKRRTGF